MSLSRPWARHAKERNAAARSQGRCFARSKCRETRLLVPSKAGGISARRSGRAGLPGKVLLQHIGTVLQMQQKMVGRVETGESPELVWEHPELDRLYMRLAEEYELRERGRAIDRKLEIVSRTVETLLSVEQKRSSVRGEWYIDA